MVSGSTSRVFHLLTSMWLGISWSTEHTWPMAGTMQSQGMTNSEPSTGSGRRRPEASGSPSCMRRHSRPLTTPSSAMIFVGATRVTISTPSSLASTISTWSAGISASVRRYSSLTSSNPMRRDERTQSMATLPPPMTSIVLPLSGTLPKAISRRNSTPGMKPWYPASSPSQPMRADWCAPTATNTAS